MKLDFLSKKIYLAVSKLDMDKLRELRIRLGFPIKVLYETSQLYLSINGISKLKDNAIICERNDIDEIIKNVTEFSIYAHNNKIKQGYLTAENGIRIGISGECVFDNNNIITIKNISSLNVRIPHLIENCSLSFINKIISTNSIYNTLIISPPGIGKTTMLKDISLRLNEFNFGSILIIDERGEFDLIKGENIDKITYSNKGFAFEYAIRSLSPKIIVTDELATEKDWESVYMASKSGVKIIASAHGHNLDDVISKRFYFNDVFERFIVLDEKNIGNIKSVYNENYSLI